MQANPILLQRKYARIVKLFAEQTGLTYEQALDFFYKSKTFELISEGVADMHCLSDEYLAEELMIERDKQQSWLFFPFNDSDFFFRQAIELVDETVDFGF